MCRLVSGLALLCSSFCKSHHCLQVSHLHRCCHKPWNSGAFTQCRHACKWPLGYDIGLFAPQAVLITVQSANVTIFNRCAIADSAAVPLYTIDMYVLIHLYSQPPKYELGAAEQNFNQPLISLWSVENYFLSAIVCLLVLDLIKLLIAVHYMYTSTSISFICMKNITYKPGVPRQLSINEQLLLLLPIEIFYNANAQHK